MNKTLINKLLITDPQAPVQPFTAPDSSIAVSSTRKVVFKSNVGDSFDMNISEFASAMFQASQDHSAVNPAAAVPAVVPVVVPALIPVIDFFSHFSRSQLYFK